MKNEIEKIYTKYNFMDKETLDKYINIAYEKSSKNKEPIKKILYNLLNKEIYISLKKCDMKYINNYIDLNSNIKNNNILFKKICSFFTNFSFTPNIDFAIKLITENKKMAAILSEIYSDKKGNVDNLFNDYIPKIFITAYLFLNNLNDKKEVDGIKKLGYDEEYELINIIPDEKTDIENLHLEDSMILDVRRVFENSNLNEREKDILINRFGLYGNDEQVLKDLGDKYQVSKERIRKIQEDSLKKLRDDKKIIELSIYMNNPEKALESLKTLKKKKYKQGRKK